MTQPEFAVLDGHRIAFDTRGEGPGALVFVHGWTSGRWQWRGQMEAGGWNRRLLALDLPGHGESDRPETAYSMTFFARAVAAAMDAAGMERAVLVGHSNGAAVARRFYRLHPARTEGLVAADGALRPIAPDQLRWFRAAVERPDYEAFIRGLAAQLPRGGLAQDDWDRLRRGQTAMPRHVMRGGLEAMADRAGWTEEPITVPLLVMTRESDGLEAYLRRFVSRLEFQVWEGASHFFPLEHPDRFNAALRRWLVSLV